MKKGICLIIAATIALGLSAQRSLDFASKFMQKYKDSTFVTCITVSPKMMEQIAKRTEQNKKEETGHIIQVISKLKSARIITADNHCNDCYRTAESLLKRNRQRFGHSQSYNSEHAHGTFYTRKNKKGSIIELVMLHEDKKTDRLTIVNLTGNIDNEFMDGLIKAFGERGLKP
ncbi:DUF4252 domain-containing protein [Xylanibacter muris]|uniref:DUF4252 domain-containing protein n=1 Tax=Xylanibacter muris TaxID=2736290 RepID=A0ABX2AMW7_9BACT|nr:DUF4252 domain-containing protein [Xylanibacter muris]NPD92538.1 DUF4252 domain-containing protein [Xylanibacter muris]